MDNSEIFKKVAAGEELTAEEKTAVGEINLDASYAAIRKKAEGEYLAKFEADQATTKKASEELQAKFDALAADKEKAETDKLSESEQLAKQMEALTAKMKASDERADAAETSAAAQKRALAITGIREAKGIRFAKHVDPELANYAWTKAFDGVDENNTEAVEGAVKTFETINKALILAEGGTGTGTNSSGRSSTPTDDDDDMTDAKLSEHMASLKT